MKSLEIAIFLQSLDPHTPKLHGHVVTRQSGRGCRRGYAPLTDGGWLR